MARSETKQLRFKILLLFHKSHSTISFIAYLHLAIMLSMKPIENRNKMKLCRCSTWQKAKAKKNNYFLCLKNTQIYHKDKRNCEIYLFSKYLLTANDFWLYCISHFIEHNDDLRAGAKYFMKPFYTNRMKTT